MTHQSNLSASAGSMPADLDAGAVPVPRDSIETTGALRPGDLVDDWVAAPSCTSPSFAPDGSLAYVGNRAGHPALWIRDLAGDERLVEVGPGHVGSVIWSPDGAWIAVTVAPGGGEHTEVRVVRPDGSGLRRLAGGAPASELSGDVVTLQTGGAAAPSAASHGRWTGDSAWLAVCESVSTGMTHAMLVDPETGRRVHLATGQALLVLDVFADAHVADVHVADAHLDVGVDDGVDVGVDDGVDVDVDDDVAEHSDGRSATTRPEVGVEPALPARRLLLREGPRGRRRILLVDVVTGACHDVVEASSTVAFGRFAPDGRSVYLVTDSGRERPTLVEVPLATEQEGRPATEKMRVLAARPDADVERFVLLSGDSDSPAAAVVLWNVRGRSELTHVDLADGRCRRLPPPPRDVVTTLLVVRGGAGNRLLLAAEGPTTPGELWTYDLASASAGYRCLVSHVPTAFPAPALASVGGVDPAATPTLTPTPALVTLTSTPVPAPRSVGRLVRPVPRTFTAHDGLELSGWWYRPYGLQGPLPTLLYFHGGPESQERPTFNPLFQALATRGVAVFAPNVRGSSGFGRAFVTADDHDRRFAGVADVASCVEFLVGSGLSDPARIGVAGRSYGGYLTLMALVTYPELFRVGVDVCGIADFESFYAHTEPWIGGPAVTKYGDPDADRALLRLLSPMHRMAALAAPLMVVHGSNDTNVPVVEAEQAVAAATARGVACRYLLFDGEGHDVAGLANRTVFVREVVDWVSTHLAQAPDSEAPDSQAPGGELSEAV